MNPSPPTLPKLYTGSLDLGDPTAPPPSLTTATHHHHLNDWAIGWIIAFTLSILFSFLGGFLARKKSVSPAEGRSQQRSSVSNVAEEEKESNGENCGGCGMTKNQRRNMKRRRKEKERRAAALVTDKSPPTTTTDCVSLAVQSPPTTPTKPSALSSEVLHHSQHLSEELSLPPEITTPLALSHSLQRSNILLESELRRASLTDENTLRRESVKELIESEARSSKLRRIRDKGLGIAVGTWGGIGIAIAICSNNYSKIIDGVRSSGGGPWTYYLTQTGCSTYSLGYLPTTLLSTVLPVDPPSICGITNLIFPLLLLKITHSFIDLIHLGKTGHGLFNLLGVAIFLASNMSVSQNVIGAQVLANFIVGASVNFVGVWVFGHGSGFYGEVMLEVYLRFATPVLACGVAWFVGGCGGGGETTRLLGNIEGGDIGQEILDFIPGFGGGDGDVDGSGGGGGGVLMIGSVVACFVLGIAGVNAVNGGE